jgi:hypothetical protein
MLQFNVFMHVVGEENVLCLYISDVSLELSNNNNKDLGTI